MSAKLDQRATNSKERETTNIRRLLLHQSHL
jgi:hypothetical protein